MIPNYNFKHNLRENWDLLAVILIYFLLGFFLFKYYLYITGVDGICYISIAQKYATGDFSNAINGYWGPLFSWLLVPFLVKGFTPLFSLISAKTLSLIIGFTTLIGLRWLSHRVEIDETIRKLFVFALIIPILCFAFTELTADLLMTCSLVFCLVFLLDPNYPNNYWNGLICGFTGSLAYFSKSFGFPFFLILFVLFGLFYYFKKFKSDKRVIKNLILGLTVFLLLSASWILILHEKYGEVTIGTSGTYNYNALGPDVQLQHPMNKFGVIKPPNDKAISGWEDPSYVKLRSWSPFESWPSFQYQLKLIGENILGFITLMFWFSPIMLPVLLWGFIAYLKTSDKRFKWGIMSILVTISLFIMGYLPFFIQARYFYLVYFLSFILGVYLLNEIIERKNFKNHRKNFLLFIFFFLFVVSPFITLSYNANSYGGIYELSEILRNDYHVQGNIASDSEALTSFYMSYLLDSSYMGAITTNTINLDLKLETEGVDYYLVWDTNGNVQLGSYTEIKHIEGMYPRVFKKNDQ
jgi:hypothetical protein